jgi:hypothetical protein
MKTRPSNIDQHPGLAVAATKRKRRTKAEMKADQEYQQQQQQANEKLLEKKIRVVASLEKNISARDQQTHKGVAETRRLRHTSGSQPRKSNIAVSAEGDSSADDEFPDGNDFDEPDEDRTYQPLSDSPTDDEFDDMDEDKVDSGQHQKRPKKVQRGEMREAVKAHQNGIFNCRLLKLYRLSLISLLKAVRIKQGTGDTAIR